MSYVNRPKEQGLVKAYLGFIDTNALFKKPISCLFAILSILIPLSFLFLIIHLKDIIFEDTQVFIASILTLLVLFGAGFFGALIWWHRRINLDEGSRLYVNLRRFIQTLGEWTGTLLGIIVFGVTVIFLIFFEGKDTLISPLLPFLFFEINYALPFYGLIGGFFIILATKIFLFLLDILVRLIGKIWNILVSIILYYYRCIVKVHRTIELNTSVWIGLVWFFSAAAAITGLVLCFKLIGASLGVYLLALIPLALGLGFMAFLVVKRKNYDA